MLEGPQTTRSNSDPGDRCTHGKLSLAAVSVLADALKCLPHLPNEQSPGIPLNILHLDIFLSRLCLSTCKGLKIIARGWGGGESQAALGRRLFLPLPLKMLCPEASHSFAEHHGGPLIHF